MDMDQPDSNHGLVRSRFEGVRRARPLLIGDALLWRRAALIIAGLGLVVLYGDVAVGLVNAWIINPDYSHGFLIAPLCAYFVWERRRRLAALELRPSSMG